MASSNTPTEQLTVASNDSVSTKEAATHQVNQGESFWTIAKQYGTTVAELRQLNPIDSPYLRVGSLLKLPAKVAEPTKENTQLASKPPETGPTVDSSNTPTEQLTEASNDSVSTKEAATHQVSQGESFWTIAKQYGTTVAELRQLNPIDSPYLRVGSLLKLPATIATPAKAAEPPTENTQPASKPPETGPTADSSNTPTEQLTEASNDSVSTKEAATHQVSQGESFWTIAKQYGTTVAELRHGSTRLTVPI